MRRARPWAWTLALGLLAIGVHGLLRGELQTHVYDLIAAAAPVAIVVGIRVHRPVRRAPWLLLAVGTGLWVVGDVVFNALGSPFPSIADVAYLASYPAFVVAIAQIARTRMPGRDVAGLVDAAFVTVAALLPAWMYLMSPVAGAHESSALERMVSVAYPLADLFVMAVLARLLVQPGRRPPALWLLVGGIAMNLVADTVFAVPAVSNDYSAGSPLESLFLIGYVLLAAAALHPSMREVAAPGKVRPGPTQAPWRVAIFGVAALVVPLLIGIEHVQGRHDYIPLLLVGWCLLVGLAVIRLGALIRELIRSAQCDPLTGLPNRTLLLERVERLLQQGPADRAGVALLYVDLDRFKAVNDSVGHAGGDLLLVEVSDRVRDAVRPNDLVCRLGGDEFVVLCQDIGDDNAARVIADRIVDVLSRPFVINGVEHELSASVGISRVTPDTNDPHHLVHAADTAMYRAKLAGKARSEIYT